MTAHEKFKKGDLVKASPLGIKEGIFRSDGLGHRGTVIGFCTSQESAVRILTDNRKHARVWHMDFWDLAGVEGKP